MKRIFTMQMNFMNGIGNSSLMREDDEWMDGVCDAVARLSIVNICRKVEREKKTHALDYFAH